jgi:hypothetical protein
MFVKYEIKNIRFIDSYFGRGTFYLYKTGQNPVIRKLAYIFLLMVFIFTVQYINSFKYFFLFHIRKIFNNYNFLLCTNSKNSV